MKRARGFTLLEIVVVVAIIAVLTTAAGFYVRAGMRNAQLAGATGEISNRIFALRMAALADGVDRLLVFVDAPGSDARGCGWFDTSGCARFFVLRGPSADWALSSFDFDAPGGSGTATAAVMERQTLGPGVHLDLGFAPPALPSPFDGVTVHDAALVGDGLCHSRSCFAVRFTYDGKVMPVYVDDDATEKAGLAFVLGTDKTVETNAAERKEVLISFPAGIVRILTY